MRPKGKTMAKKSTKSVPSTQPNELTLEQVTGIVMLGRKCFTDEAARVPPGTLASLVPLGYAEAVGSIFHPTSKSKEKVKEWLDKSIAAAASRKTNPPVTTEPGETKGKKAKYLPEKTIKLKTSCNPWKVGSKQFTMHNLCAISKTVGEYLCRGGDKTALSYFVYRGTVEVI